MRALGPSRVWRRAASSSATRPRASSFVQFHVHRSSLAPPVGTSRTPVAHSPNSEDVDEAQPASTAPLDHSEDVESSRWLQGTDAEARELRNEILKESGRAGAAEQLISGAGSGTSSSATGASGPAAAKVDGSKKGTAKGGGGASGTSKSSSSSSSTSMDAAAATGESSSPDKFPSEEISGHLWFSNIYPGRRNFFDIRHALTTQSHRTLIPQLLPQDSLSITRFVCRHREGGVYVDFVANPRFARSILQRMGVSIQMRKDEKTSLEVHSFVARQISKYMREHDFKAPLANFYVRAFEVLGSPFYDHYEGRYPSNVLHLRLTEDIVGGAKTRTAIAESAKREKKAREEVEGDPNSGDNSGQDVGTISATKKAVFEIVEKGGKRTKMAAMKAKMKASSRKKESDQEAEAAAADKSGSLEQGDSSGQTHKIVDLNSPSLQLVVRGQNIGEAGSGGSATKEQDEAKKTSARMQRVLEEAVFYSEENLHAAMRVFGPVVDMHFNKERAEWEIQFLRVHSAVAVRNCLHRAPLHKIYSNLVYKELRDQYEKDALSEMGLQRLNTLVGNDAQANSSMDDAADTRSRLRKGLEYMADRATQLYVLGSTSDPEALRKQQAVVLRQYMANRGRVPSTAPPMLPKTIPAEFRSDKLLAVKYKQTYDLRSMREQLIANWRMVALLAIAGVGLCTTFLFDPMRLFFVKGRIHLAYVVSGSPTNTELELRDNKAQKKDKSEASSSLLDSALATLWRWSESLSSVYAFRFSGSGKRSNLATSLAIQREADLASLRHWLRTDPPERVMLLSGPRGDGKDFVVHKLLEGTPGVIHLDFAPMLARFKEERFVAQNLTRMFGYFPAMRIFDESAAILDTFVPGASKVAGGSGSNAPGEAIGNMLMRILSFTTVALSEFKTEREDYRDTKYPLFVIQGFTQENHGSIPNFLRTIIQWAALVSEQKLAKVVFVIDGSWSHTLFQETLKHRPELLDELVWGDAPEVIVRRWLREFLKVHCSERDGPREMDAMIDRVIEVLGGRLSDLEIFVSKVETDGMHPQAALSEMVDASASTVRQLLVRGEKDTSKDELWSRNQLWRAIEILALNSVGETSEIGVPYDSFLDYVMRGDERVLRHMLAAQLISRVQDLSCSVPNQTQTGAVSSGSASTTTTTTTTTRATSSSDAELSNKKQYIRAGSALFGEVYSQLYSERGLRAIYGLATVKEDIANVENALKGYEDQLRHVYEAEKEAREAESFRHESWLSWLRDLFSRTVIHDRREELETVVMETRKLHLLQRILKEQDKLRLLSERKDAYSGEMKKNKRKIVPFAI
ncbi:unnamed protein product [Amoebophrya sp. A25]|nr:unnamed protein product [Amoebophrya sp. A25]|eukprot:GSA25T00000806001.1